MVGSQAVEIRHVVGGYVYIPRNCSLWIRLAAPWRRYVRRRIRPLLKGVYYYATLLFCSYSSDNVIWFLFSFYFFLKLRVTYVRNVHKQLIWITQCNNCVKCYEWSKFNMQRFIWFFTYFHFERKYKHSYKNLTRLSLQDRNWHLNTAISN